VTPVSDLSAEEIERYGRHLVLPEVGREGQQRLKEASVVVVGVGGLGTPVALYLAAAGIGTLGIVDDDRVEISNLQRQILYGEADVGRAKTEVARERLRHLNPHVEVIPHELRLNRDNALDVLEPYDIVVDGSDNFPTRYLLNDAAVLLGKPDVYGAIHRFEGQVGIFDARSGACYRCLFDEPPPPELAPSCAEAGVLGVLPGIVGSLQASETIKSILGIGRSLRSRLIVLDALEMRVREVEVPKNPDCPVCADNPRQTELIDYEAFCAGAAAEPPPAAEAEFDITPKQLHRRLTSGASVSLLDVRTPQEFAIAHLEGTRLIPLQQLAARVDELSAEDELIVYCHTGQRSAHATRWLRDRGFSRARNLAGGIDAWSRTVDPSVPRY
jgi:molybdopterin/thiamine biosynthesis adenylyltransferase/rhodanese-related sulfurtransferase